MMEKVPQRGYHGQMHVKEAGHVFGSQNSLYWYSMKCNLGMIRCKTGEVKGRVLYFKLVTWTLQIM